MAYDFIPTKASEIYGHSKLKNYVVQAGDMVNVFDYLRNLDSKIDDPIAIDVDKKMVKVLKLLFLFQIQIWIWLCWLLLVQISK